MAVHPRIARFLAQHEIPHRVWEHSSSPTPIRSPADFVAFSGIAHERISKTLFLSTGLPHQPFVLAVAPIAARVEMGILTTLAGARKLQLGSRADLAAQLDFPPQGVSPLAGHLPVYIHEKLLEYSTITIGGGVAGVEIELAASWLCNVNRAQRGAFCG